MHRHENRAVQSLRIVVPDGEVSQELSIPRKSRKIDLMYVFLRAEPVFGPWSAVLQDRAVLIELYSGFPTRSNLYGATAKWGHCAEEWSGRNRRKANRDLPERALNTSRPPICIILASRVSRRGCSAIPGMRPLNMPGAWATPDLDQGGYLLLDQSALPDTPGMSFLRWLQTPTNSAEAHRRLQTLLGDEEIPILTRSFGASQRAHSASP